MKHIINCGSAPKEVGIYRPPVGEMMFYLYLPIKMPKMGLRLPARLLHFDFMLRDIEDDFGDWTDHYVYMTAKTMFVSKGASGNREGWHIDGFGSNGDINYVWADKNPTEYAVQQFNHIPNDDRQSMVEIERQIDSVKIITYDNCALMRLDETIVHRVSPNVMPCLRSFLKVTISKHEFKNFGNSHNYLFNYKWGMKPRSMDRNLDHG